MWCLQQLAKILENKSLQNHQEKKTLHNPHDTNVYLSRDRIFRSQKAILGSQIMPDFVDSALSLCVDLMSE